MERAKPECECLSGKVRKTTLPIFDGPPAAGAPPLKRLLLPQGELAQFHHGEPAMRYIAFVELRQNSVRGNHFHKRKQELIYILTGEVLLTLEDVERKTRETMRVQAGELVIIAPGVAHVFQITTSGQAVEFSTATFDPADTFRYAVSI